MTLAYCDTFALSQWCHCKRAEVYHIYLRNISSWFLLLFGKIYFSLLQITPTLNNLVVILLWLRDPDWRVPVARARMLLAPAEDGRTNGPDTLPHGCQMAIARFLDRMCLALWASRLWLRYATLQNLIPSFPWIAPPHPPPWHNPRKGRDQILPSGNTGPSL